MLFCIPDTSNGHLARSQKKAIDFHIISLFPITLEKVGANQINKQIRKT